MDLATVALIVVGLLFLVCIAAFALAECNSILPQYRSHVVPTVVAVPTHHPQLQQTIRTIQSAINALIIYANNSRHLGPLIQMVHIVISLARLIRVPPIHLSSFAVVEETNTATSTTCPEVLLDHFVTEPSRTARIQNGRSLRSDLVFPTSLNEIYLPNLSAAIGTPAIIIASGNPSVLPQSETSSVLSAPRFSTSQPAVH
ncbi:hypothetical protein M407DRAFT_17924 [Tulasnella calospora MUT 4182]|uniref:Uncharacterized protein n=1 Tax=Tulasnella calospora MUT 4182 TaxID=1051891 RepID=A0A0C3QV43_9AGAM|nr:hypothetical protein M407DRAFT_17924 [Tulasnella calospora MUT 4182]